ncbi:hypothetical protein [Paenibacillus castaneae]|nr:hypothetical protein [Paenibacillus castaneae]
MLIWMIQHTSAQRARALRDYMKSQPRYPIRALASSIIEVIFNSD